jgi:hypothetical protein
MPTVARSHRGGLGSLDYDASDELGHLGGAGRAHGLPRPQRHEFREAFLGCHACPWSGRFGRERFPGGTS